jgi:hypothetical protein
VLLPGQYFSHTTAAALHGMRLPSSHDSLILHVTYSRAHRSMRRPSVIGHKTTMPPPLGEVDGLPVSLPIDVWCESAAILTVRDLIVMGDGLLRRKAPLATLEQLREVVAARRGRRGAARLRLALPHLRGRTDSARETELRLIVVRFGFPEPVVNDPLFNSHGTVIAHGDLVWPEYRTVLEYDGRQHAEDRVQFAIDVRRLNIIAQAKYHVIRVDAELFADRTQLFGLIDSALRTAGWRPAKGR